MKKILFASLISFIAIFLINNLAQAEGTPQITEVVPSDNIEWLQTLTIKGSGFGTNASSKLLINGLEAGSDEQWSDSEISLILTIDDGKSFSDRLISTVEISSSDDWLEVEKAVSINIKPSIAMVRKISKDASMLYDYPKDKILEGGDILFISGSFIKPGQDKVYIDTFEATWDLSNTTPIPYGTTADFPYTVNTFIKLPNNLSSVNELIIVTPEGLKSRPFPLSGHNFSLKPACDQDIWNCGDFSECRPDNTQIRTCTKTFECNGVETPKPATTQLCSYTPPCSVDTWECGSWGACSPQGIQTRNCSRTYDCQSAETASPAVSQYCSAPNQPKQQTPSEDLGIVNQNSIIKSTVKLICPVSRTMASQGSGTVIDSKGTILTNKHVIDGTYGCLVGFIDSYSDEPYFGDRQITDIYKMSGDADVAVLKLRNPNNKILTSINISQSNSNNIKLGEILTTYGYPAKFGTKITYTSGDFSGVDGNYLKTTAIIEHGNSGGGAYLKNGAFIGIPSAVIKGSVNSMGYLLSVNKVNSWLNGSSYAYDSGNNNNYSRVSSILEDIDLSSLDSLGLYIAGDDVENQNKTKSKEKTQNKTQAVVEEEKRLITKVDNNLSRRVSGNILLQVEQNGEGWYVYPDNKKKYYLGRPADAFSIMRNLGLGIKHSELDNYLNSKFPSRLAGKIMLDVEQNGEAYYINPNNLKGHYLNRPADAFRIMRELGLGITNSDIRKIDVGEVN
ncbi:serine protease [Patescibacteria group bacterium]|nr:serine protease [Patescibacteria group bacterium]